MFLNLNILISILGAISLILIILIVLIIRLQLKVNKILVGKNAASLEDSFFNMSKDVKDLRAFTKEMEDYLTTVEKRLKKSIQGVETIRYNPFKGTGSGGNNSFSTAFLNEDGDGIVLTSMYARDRISVFAKPVKAFASEHELSEEEAQSISTCKQKITTQ